MYKRTIEYHGKIYGITKAIYHGDSVRDLTSGCVYEGFLIKPNLFQIIEDDAGDAQDIYAFTIVNDNYQPNPIKKYHILIGA